jgi:hypothetical protein
MTNSSPRLLKQDLAYLPEANVYRCPAGERLKYHYTNVENGLKLHRYWTNACRTCALKSRFMTAVQRRITWWEHEPVLEAVQRRLDPDPQPCVGDVRRSSILSARSRRGWEQPTS